MSTKKILLYIILVALVLLLLVTLASRISAYTAKLLIYEDMTYGAIKTILGSEGRSCNLSIIVYEWDFPDGSVMTIWLSTPTPGKAAPRNEYYATRIEITKGSFFPNVNPA